MKQSLFIFISCILILSCGQNKQSEGGAKIEFENVEYNVGKIEQGKTAECYFIVKNIGDSTLVFNLIIPECDCTSLTNNNKEILAGKTDTLKFIFDTYKKVTGKFVSEIRVITNTIPDLHKLKIIAEIE